MRDLITRWITAYTEMLPENRPGILATELWYSLASIVAAIAVVALWDDQELARTIVGGGAAYALARGIAKAFKRTPPPAS